MDTTHSRKSSSRLSVPSGAETTTNAPQPISSTARLLWSSRNFVSLERITDVRQMDMQSALDQMKTLLSLRPQMIYKTAYYRKQTKNHWARDDPGFMVLQLVFLGLSCFAYDVAFKADLANSLSFLLASVVWNWLGLGVIICSVNREIANRYLQTSSSGTHVRQQVEWLYAFDIHCNSFFPVFVVLYGIQFFTLPVVLGDGLFPLLLANSMYGAALAWYWYITHLGYRALPFLANTEVFLFPIAAIAIIFALLVVVYPFGYGVNAAQFMAKFYFL